MSASAISQTVTFFLCFLQINSVQENLELNMDSFDRKFFIQYLFTKYGNRTIMTYEGFEHLMNGIELGNIILDDTIDAHHKLNSTDFQTLHGTNHSHVIDTSDQTTRRRRHAKHEVHDTDQSNDLLKTVSMQKSKFFILNHEHNSAIMSNYMNTNKRVADCQRKT